MATISIGQVRNIARLAKLKGALRYHAFKSPTYAGVLGLAGVGTAWGVRRTQRARHEKNPEWNTTLNRASWGTYLGSVPAAVAVQEHVKRKILPSLIASKEYAAFANTPSFNTWTAMRGKRAQLGAAYMRGGYKPRRKVSAKALELGRKLFTIIRGGKK